MKYLKKYTAVIAFVLGAAVFITTALADTFIGSGYESFKDALKNTAEVLTSGQVNSYETITTITMKIDGVTYIENTTHSRRNYTENTSEFISTSYNFGERQENYSYMDSRRTISNWHGTYHVTEFRGGDNRHHNMQIENPFANDGAADVERIADAFVGNLAELILVEESGGKKMFAGSINETQIPALANALASYLLRNEFSINHRAFNSSFNTRLDDMSDFTQLPASSMFIQSASGKAVQNEMGIIESLIAEVRASAVDQDGITRTYSIEVTFQLTGINTTIVRAPNLDGVEVSTTIQYVEEDGSIALSEKLIGLYYDNIVEESAGRWVKTGENWLEVLSVDGNVINARMYELDIEGNEVHSQYISARAGDDPWEWSFFFDYTNKNGEEKLGMISYSDGIRLSVNLDVTIRGQSFLSEEWVDYRRFFE